TARFGTNLRRATFTPCSLPGESRLRDAHIFQVTRSRWEARRDVSGGSMYGTAQHSGGRARMTGLITAAALTRGAGWVFTTGLAKDFIPELQKKMEVFILQPEKPKEVEKLPDPPKVEKTKPVEVPPPELVAPDIPIPVDTTPVITAPPAPPEPVV